MTWAGHRFLAAIGLAGALALGGCAYDDGYYGGVSVGTGYYGGGYYDDYWGPGYYRPGFYSGWYDGFYYPGSGYYIYDRSGHRHRWNDSQRRYWESRRDVRRGDGYRGTRPDAYDGRRWNRDGNAMRPADPSGTRAPQSGRRQDMTTPRSGWNRGDAPRTRDGDGSRERGWRDRRD